ATGWTRSGLRVRPRWSSPSVANAAEPPSAVASAKPSGDIYEHWPKQAELCRRRALRSKHAGAVRRLGADHDRLVIASLLRDSDPRARADNGRCRRDALQS